jgi:hypothetical protein
LNGSLLFVFSWLFDPTSPASVVGLAVLGLAGFAVAYLLQPATRLERQTIVETVRRFRGLGGAQPGAGRGA